MLIRNGRETERDRESPFGSYMESFSNLWNAWPQDKTPNGPRKEARRSLPPPKTSKTGPLRSTHRYSHKEIVHLAQPTPLWGGEGVRQEHLVPKGPPGAGTGSACETEGVPFRFPPAFGKSGSPPPRPEMTTRKSVNSGGVGECLAMLSLPAFIPPPTP